LCASATYAITFDDSILDPVVNLNPTSQIFSVFYEDDLIPSGATEQSYPVTASITLTDSLGVETVQQAPF